MTTCKCPNPPGGFVSCSENQVAICRYRNGQFEAMCIDVPEYINGRRELKLVLRARHSGGPFSSIPYRIEGHHFVFELYLAVLGGGPRELENFRSTIKIGPQRAIFPPPPSLEILERLVDEGSLDMGEIIVTLKLPRRLENSQ